MIIHNLCILCPPCFLIFLNIFLFLLLDHCFLSKINLKKHNCQFLLGIILNYFLITILITDIPYIFFCVQSNISAILIQFKRDIIDKSVQLLSYILVHKNFSPLKIDTQKFQFLPQIIITLHMHT